MANKWKLKPERVHSQERRISEEDNKSDCGSEFIKKQPTDLRLNVEHELSKGSSGGSDNASAGPKSYDSS